MNLDSAIDPNGQARRTILAGIEREYAGRSESERAVRPAALRVEVSAMTDVGDVVVTASHSAWVASHRPTGGACRVDELGVGAMVVGVYPGLIRTGITAGFVAIDTDRPVTIKLRIPRAQLVEIAGTVGELVPRFAGYSIRLPLGTPPLAPGPHEATLWGRPVTMTVEPGPAACIERKLTGQTPGEELRAMARLGLAAWHTAKTAEQTAIGHLEAHAARDAWERCHSGYPITGFPFGERFASGLSLTFD